MNQLQFISGLANCHLPGLYSFVISERVSPEIGMKRVFYAGSRCDMNLWDRADFRLKPHNHRQSIRLTLLFGEASNVDFTFDRYGNLALWKYGFRSALLNDRRFGLERMWREDARFTEEPITSQGLHLHWSDVHTVTASRESAWLVEEFEQAPAGTERCYSTSDHLTLDSRGLYVPLDTRTLRGFESVLNEKLQRANAVNSQSVSENPEERETMSPARS